MELDAHADVLRALPRKQEPGPRPGSGRRHEVPLRHSTGRVSSGRGIQEKYVRRRADDAAVVRKWPPAEGSPSEFDVTSRLLYGIPVTKELQPIYQVWKDSAT
ncbi:hypothetical protein [Streptomyces sp. NPDC096012]|uniref:hypothetical protein n=1 Tax=Streptomyces sp. NPDC096012 TaxID=3155684 RepID=UPI00336A6DB3